MHFNLDEQEQLAELKAWWKQYGKWLIAILILILLSYTLFTTWNWWQNRSALAASKLYDTLLVSAQKQDVPGVLRASKDLQDQYSSTSYAGMAGLVAAQAANSSGDMGTAEQQLRWTMSKASSDAHRDVARARLVSLLIDKPDFADAEKVASASVSTAFEPLLLERRGDVQLAQQKTVEARQFYQQAWDKLAKNPDAADEAKHLLKVKLDAVGGR
jgi:predicted negative regulator of RcsB-dependent stress response